MKRIVALTLTLVLVFGLMAGCSQKTSEFPGTQSITVIIPKAAGGGTDVAARGLMEVMTEQSGTKFNIVNKPDGGGITGMVELSNAKADGYTLGAVTVELAMFPHQGKTELTYEDFDVIGAIIASIPGIVVPADAPYDTVGEFVDYARENPGELSAGNSGAGAIWHLAAVSFEREFDLSLTHVPYPNGTADIIAALAGGHIDCAFIDTAAISGQLDAGQLKVLGILDSERMEIRPDIPTCKEQGYDIVVKSWAALAAPKGLPEDVLKYLRDLMSNACDDSSYQEYFINQSIQPAKIIGNDMYDMMKSDHERYAEIFETLDIS